MKNFPGAVGKALRRSEFGSVCKSTIGSVCPVLVTMMEVLAATDAFTTGSGLLTAGLSDERVISIPLEGRGNVRLGWLRAKNTKSTPQAEQFLRLLAEATADAAAYTRTLQERRVVRRG